MCKKTFRGIWYIIYIISQDDILYIVYHKILKTVDNNHMSVYYINRTVTQRRRYSMQIEFEDKTPIYLQIIDLVKTQMATGKLKGGDKLPSVREMSVSLKVNPNTIQRAYQELERDNLIYSQRGMGNYVTEDLNMVKGIKNQMAQESINTFINSMKTLGFSSDEIVDTVKKSLKGEIMTDGNNIKNK